MNEHILVVDDEAPIRDLLSTFFRKRNYKVTTAATAEEAQKLAKEPSLKLVILDIALGEEDGLQLLAALKGDHPKLPVIILTGMGFDDELLQEALEKGASGYVSKTLPLEQLLMEVHRTLKQHPQAS
jgi:DNA-binding response OmpR family regulator